MKIKGENERVIKITLKTGEKAFKMYKLKTFSPLGMIEMHNIYHWKCFNRFVYFT